MLQPAFTPNNAAVANQHSQKLAHVRQRLLSIFINDKRFVDTLLGQADESSAISDEQLLENIEEVSALLLDLHAADIADILEALPYDERLALWKLIDNNHRGEVLVEASTPIWDNLIKGMSDVGLLRAIGTLHVDEQAYIAEHLPRETSRRLLTYLEPSQRNRIREVLQYHKDSIGQMMDFEFVTVRDNVTLNTVQRFLRSRGSIPETTDKIFVIDRKNRLQGELPLTLLLTSSPDKLVAEVMHTETVTFLPEQKGEDAASAFERYDLISAAVVDNNGRLLGRLTVEDIVDTLSEETDTNIRRMGGLSREEDVFAPVGQAVKTRWTWLAINLCTAFVASRVIGLFEHTISQLVALATLMPIVAGIGGNTGNQTITMIVRALALHQIQTGSFSYLLLRELGVALINGIIWGGIMGIVTYLLYSDLAMGGVMTMAMVLNLLMAALMGVLIPLVMMKLGRDPAIGSSVMITAITDTGGFFIFLGLATLFLV
ncbi:magnesium transporter [Xenorhabdus nematophila]|uniref:Magnesium transporter MgtE n=1 Tax=Xenorhabdus nematophila (strain ATCC 19061 / DSM 3370 / CCUG 14189 / LMG 1036 / NCIMB 9965 / AN6) TaxID=406817 RepID=D3VI92_XENNA|nr:magnesium transporter [Xenorhabdus nematophila]CEE90107.1 putative divalent cation transport protein (divalent cation transporter) [Xenorhabdus nematophila str. Anatoliense]CEF29299.1 putative divalent cation transport protein (divalent cation transporter) [Xenorhabdus nematophila str. Websteri]AYA39976.1 magnesium transporter [Xenorhabdus nematophila]MBA0018614.1 magnesium transporter [Xenorhabdus nematophila]MCB4425743.1 magnesium transporter [Xenorhabdus nematophila]